MSKRNAVGWLGIGPEQSSPEEAFCQFFDDAQIESFLSRTDVGLSGEQVEAGLLFVNLMKELSAATPQFIDPNTLLDDPRWTAVRQAAQRFLGVLKAN